MGVATCSHPSDDGNDPVLLDCDTEAPGTIQAQPESLFKDVIHTVKTVIVSAGLNTKKYLVRFRIRARLGLPNMFLHLVLSQSFSSLVCWFQPMSHQEMVTNRPYLMSIVEECIYM